MDISGILCIVLQITVSCPLYDICLMKMLHEMLHVCEPITHILFIANILLQRVSIACYAKRCISHRKSVRLTV